jgi:hypothetical protein
MVPRLAPPKAFPEGRMKGTEFVEEPLDLTGVEIELRQCIYSKTTPYGCNACKISM